MRRHLKFAALAVGLFVAPSSWAQAPSGCIIACNATNSTCKATVLPAWRVCMTNSEVSCKTMPASDRRRCTQNASMDCSAKGTPVVEACEAAFSTCVDACMAAEKKPDTAAVATPSDDKALMQAVCGNTALQAEFLKKVEAARGKHEREIAAFEIEEGCAVKAMPPTPQHDTADMADDRTHLGPVNSAHYSSDGKTVVSGGDDGTVRFWDVETGKQLRSFKIAPPPPPNARFPRNAVRSVRLIGDGSRVAVASDNSNVALVDALTGKTIAELPQGPEIGSQWRVAPQLAVSSNDLLWMASTRSRVEEVWGYDLKTGAIRHRLGGHGRGAKAVTVSNSAGIIATGAYEQVMLWRADTGQLIGVIKRAGSETADAIAFSRDGRQIAIAFGPNVEVYDVANKSLIRAVKVHPLYSASEVAFTADGKGLLTCRAYPMLWDIATGQIVRRFGPFLDVCESLDVSPDGKFLVTTARASDVRIWDIASGTFYRRLGQMGKPWQ